MANGFGFVRPGQRPSPDPSQVGAALMQRQGQAQGPAPPQQVMAGPAEPAGFDFGALERAPDPAPDADLRRKGALLMGGAGQGEDGAINAAVGEALTRMGGGYQTSPNPLKPRALHVERLRALGLSDIEAQLLGETGGF